jgi:hypothetical protein
MRSGPEQPPERIPFGLRRYPLLVLVFPGCALLFVYWSARVHGPTYVFPLGVRDEDFARLYLRWVVPTLVLSYLAFVTYVRFVRRPAVVLEANQISLPIGEFGWRTITIHRGSVLETQESTRRGGWRSIQVRTSAGVAALRSSMLPSDEAYWRIVERLRELQRSAR